MMQSWGPWGSCSANPELRSPEGSREERLALSSGAHTGVRGPSQVEVLLGTVDGGAGRRWGCLCRGHLRAES